MTSIQMALVLVRGYMRSIHSFLLALSILYYLASVMMAVPPAWVLAVKKDLAGKMKP
jgi:hypothetical protein